MRARILAIFILIVFLVLPLGAYYYITTKKVATITIRAGAGVNFEVQLSGTFGVDGLPLADKVLFYKKYCTDICIFSPILPARYKLILSSSGKVAITDILPVNTGDKIDKAYVFTNGIITTQVGNIAPDDTLISSLIENAKSKNIGAFFPIGIDIANRVWVRRNMNLISQIGILSQERFIPVRNIVTPIRSSRFDASRSVLIFDLVGDRLLFVPADLSDELEIHSSDSTDIVTVSPGTPWKILTQSGSMEVQGDRLLEDIRFTDSIDISSKIRIGYIDKNDITKLSLGNFPLGISHLIRLDRTNGKSLIFGKGIDIDFFFLYKNEPAYVDISGNIFVIHET